MAGKSKYPTHLYFGFRTILERASLQFHDLEVTSNSFDSTAVANSAAVGKAGHGEGDQKNEKQNHRRGRLLNGRRQQRRRPRLVVLAIRNEHKKDDFVSVNHLLMTTNLHNNSNSLRTLQHSGNLQEHQQTQWNATDRRTKTKYDKLILGTKPFPEKASREQTTFNVTKSISPLGRKRLCRALEDEYRAYIRLLHHSMNLSPREKNDSLNLSRQNCPDLKTLQVIFVPNNNHHRESEHRNSRG
ncbi:hypothetical protein ACA910_021903 [Epithemia clementina (nom. ined.)]